MVLLVQVPLKQREPEPRPLPAFSAQAGASGAKAEKRLGIENAVIGHGDVEGLTEVCRELLSAAQTRSIPVVLISARGAEIRQAYHDVENVLDYLTKRRPMGTSCQKTCARSSSSSTACTT